MSHRHRGKAVFRFVDNSGKVIHISYSLDRILAFSGGDPENDRQLVNSFLQSCGRDVKHFKEYLQEKNEVAISELSHKMLTLFRYLEASEIVELLAPLAQKESDLRGSTHFYFTGGSVLEMIEGLLNVIRENELPAYNPGGEY